MGLIRGLVSAQGAGAAEPPPPAFKISAIIGLSGQPAVIGAVTGTDMRRGVEVELEERGNQINGVPIEIAWDDSEGKSQVTVQGAAAYRAGYQHDLRQDKRRIEGLIGF